MADSRADSLIKRQEALAAERRPKEREWDEIADLVRPMEQEFSSASSGIAGGQPKSGDASKRFDGTAGYAADNFAAGLWGMVTNSANEWFRVQSAHKEINDDRAASLWLDEANRLMTAAFASRGLRFYSQAHPLYSAMVCFGAGVFFTEEHRDKKSMFFSCRPLAECYISEGEDETVDELHRRYDATAKQIVQRFGSATPAKIATAAEKNPEQRFTLLHTVLPRDQVDIRRKDSAGMPFASYFIDIDSRTVIGEKGYREFPYQVPRWGPGLYGYSPAKLSMPDIRMVNAMSKTTIIGAQKRVDPPILAPDEEAVHGIKTRPGGIIYGGIDEQGRPRYMPLQTGADIGLGLELEEQRRSQIREAFYASLLMMVQRPNMTATQFLGEQEEKLRLMAPYLGKVQSEFHDPLIDRVFAVMLRAGAFPEPPPILKRYPDLKVEYVSPLARAQKVSEANAITRVLEAVAPIASFKPEVWDNFDGDEIVRALSAAYSAPTRIMVDPREVTKTRDDRTKQQNQMAMLSAAGPAAGAVKTMAEASSLLGGIMPGGDQGGVPPGGGNA